MEKDIVDEFLEAHSKEFDTIFVDGFEQCPVCGMRPDKMKKLAAAVKELKEKEFEWMIIIIGVSIVVAVLAEHYL